MLSTEMADVRGEINNNGLGYRNRFGQMLQQA